MSYASFTQSFPDFIKSFSQKLFQPTGIAVMSSVGIHALLAVSLPYLPIASQDKPEPIRNVKLVQLTPAEQSRLPQLSPPSLSPLPNQLQSLYPLPAYPSTPLPSLSSLRDSFPYNYAQISPSPPVGNGLSSPRTSQSSKQTSKLPKKQQPSGLGVSVAQGNEPPIVIAPPSRGSMLPGRDFRQNLSDIVAGLAPATPLPPPPNSNQQTGQPPFPSPTPLGGTTGGTTQAMAPTSGEGNLTGNSSPSVYSDYNKVATDWLRRNEIASRPETIKISRNYPQKERSSGELNGGAIVVAVKVDENGKIISDSLQPMGSSYSDGAFYKEALSTVGGYQFPATGKAEAYFVQVQFKDDSRVPSSLTRPQGSPERPGSDKPQGSPERPGSDKPQGSTERPASTERPGSDKPQGSTERPASTERPSVDKPQRSTERPSADKPQRSTERPASDRPQGSAERPNADKPQGSTERPASTERPTSDKPQGSAERPTSDKPQGSAERPTSDKPQGSAERPTSDKPQGSAERPSADKPQRSPEG